MTRNRMVPHERYVPVLLSPTESTRTQSNHTKSRKPLNLWLGSLKSRTIETPWSYIHNASQQMRCNGPKFSAAHHAYRYTIHRKYPSRWPPKNSHLQQLPTLPKTHLISTQSGVQTAAPIDERQATARSTQISLEATVESNPTPPRDDQAWDPTPTRRRMEASPARSKRGKPRFEPTAA